VRTIYYKTTENAIIWYNVIMQKNYKGGFGLVAIFLILGVLAALYFYKDENGQSYLNKIIKAYPQKLEEAKSKAEDAKKLMESRDSKLQNEMKELDQ